MEWTQLWAGVTFAAQNGDAEGLLTAAAAGGLHLSDIVPRPGRRSRSGPHRDSPRRTGRNAHLSACGGQRPGAVRVGKRAGYCPPAAHRTAHRAAGRASDTVLGRSCYRSARPASCSRQGRGRSRRPALPARSLRASCSDFYRRNDILLQSFH